MTADYAANVSELARRLIGRPDAGAILRKLLDGIYHDLRGAGVTHAQAYDVIDVLGDQVVAEVERLAALPRWMH